MTRRGMAAAAAALGILALFFVPGALSQRIVTTNADAKLFDQSFASLQRLPKIVLATGPRRGGMILQGGGLRSRYECARIVRGVGGPRRWLCLSLKPDGSAPAVLWIARRPDANDAKILIDDGDQSTQPNP